MPRHKSDVERDSYAICRYARLGRGRLFPGTEIIESKLIIAPWESLAWLSSRTALQGGGIGGGDGSECDSDE